MGKVEDLPRDMNRDLVSIIIPCYRQAHFLPAAVECALAQSYGAVEVIVVNDGSDDGTEEAASRYGERITYVAKQNGGLPSARNAGIRQSHGEWLFFLDADDLIHPDAITWLVKAAAGRNGCVAQMGWRRFASDPQEEPFSDQVPPEIVEPLPRLLHENLGPVHSFLSPRKMVLDAGAFQETLRGVEDWDLWTRLALAGAQFTAVRRVGAYYRQTPGSMVRQRDVMVQARIEILLRAHREILPRGERLAALGHDLVQLEHAYLRARLARRKPDPLVPQLAAALRELNAFGYHQKRSWIVRSAEWMIGYRAELAALACFRLFRNERLNYYRSLNE